MIKKAESVLEYLCVLGSFRCARCMTFTEFRCPSPVVSLSCRHCKANLLNDGKLAKRSPARSSSARNVIADGVQFLDMFEMSSVLLVLDEHQRHVREFARSYVSSVSDEDVHKTVKLVRLLRETGCHAEASVYDRKVGVTDTLLKICNVAVKCGTQELINVYHGDSSLQTGSKVNLIGFFNHQFVVSEPSGGVFHVDAPVLIQERVLTDISDCENPTFPASF